MLSNVRGNQEISNSRGINDVKAPQSLYPSSVGSAALVDVTAKTGSGEIRHIRKNFRFASDLS